MGFCVIFVAGQSSEELLESARFCKTYGIECGVFGVTNDNEFIKLRRLGVDLCEGEIFSGALSYPEKTFYSEPHVLVEQEADNAEPEIDRQEDFDLTRFAVKTVYGFCEKGIEKWRNRATLEPLEPLELEECPEKEPPHPEEELESLERLELCEGIGAKKKRKAAKTLRKEKKRQKKEIKKGKLKKTKKLKKI
jgi:hypothetical protein